VVLPLLILWRESQPKAVPLRDIYAIPVSDSPRYRAAPLALVLVAVVTVLAVLQLPNIGFEYDLSMMRQQGTAYDQLDETQQLLVESSYAPVVVSYDDDESLRADYVRLLPAVAAGELPHVESVLSIYTVLPLDQAERVSLLGQISSMAAADNARYLPRQIRDNLDRLIAGEPRVLAPSDLPRGLQHILGVADGRHRMMLTLRGNMWDMREDKALFDEIEEWLPGRPAASEFLASAVLYRLVLTDGPRIAGLALLIIFAVTLIDLRRIGRSLGAVAAVTMGMCWAGAGMALLDVKLSLINFAGIPILMGIGIDIVIHLLHRLAEEGPGRVRYTLSTTGWASLLSTMTTILSFSALFIATNQGVRSLGTVIVLGLAMVSIAAFISVPLGWMLTWRVAGELTESD
jgi:predicted RND superfamily exporter protein